MLKKPSACIGCPFYDKGEYFTPDTYVENSTVMFLAQNPGENEEKGQQLLKREYYGSQFVDRFKPTTPQPLLGMTGKIWENKFLKLTSLNRKDVSLGNVIRCRPGRDLGMKSNQLPSITNKMALEKSKSDIVNAIKHCQSAYFSPPPTTQYIITMGQLALYATTGLTDISSWRGYGIERSTYGMFNYHTVDTNMYWNLNLPLGLSSGNIVVFPTYHIASLFEERSKKYYHCTLADYNKIKKLISKQWPLQTLPSWQSLPPKLWPKYAAFDTEYIPEDNTLLRWSLCDTDWNLYCVEAYNTPQQNIPIQPGSTVVIQNALADIGHLANIVDMSQVNIEDLMIAHSVLWTGEPHDLNYISSIYGALNRYKHLSSDIPDLYSAMDAFEPMYIWRFTMIPDFKKDKESWHIYKNIRLKLISIIDKAQQKGSKLDSDRLHQVRDVFQDKIDMLQQRAKEITGDDKFNIGGMKKLKERIYEDGYGE